MILHIWLRCWRASRTPQSWSSAERNLETEHYIRPVRAKAVERRSLLQMARVMREVVRMKKRDIIRNCSAISLAFDDRLGYKLVRFRADTLATTPTASLGEAASPTWKTIAVEGIVGCIQCLRGLDLEDFAGDYAERAAREVVDLIERLCTPLSLPKDENLFNKFVTSVQSIVADGALQKTAALLRASLPNVILITRDPSHFIRIACRDPLLRTGRFEAQNQRLFTNKDALLKKISFSTDLKARLEACQKIVLRASGSQGGDVTAVLKDFCYAPHRFESWVEPRRRYACILHAVALLLADLAGDKRVAAGVRAMAERCLDAMTPQELLETGFAADWGEVCQRFLRKFDVEDRDPSTTAALFQEFSKVVRTLFVEGWIMVDPRAPTAADEQPLGKTVTQIIFEQLEDMTYIRYGTKLKRFCKPSSKAECASALADMGSIVEDSLGRLEVDFQGLYMDLEALNIAAWSSASDAKRVQLLRASRHLCEAVKVPYSVEQWARVIKFLRRTRRARTDADHLDNRILWAVALATSRGGPMEADMEAMRPLISFFVAMTDATGQVERSLGLHATFLGAHEGGMESDAAEVCLELASEGPAAEEEIFVKDNGVLRLTDWSRACARLWRSLYGRRFAAYKQRSNKGLRGTGWRMRGSSRATALGQAQATKALMARASEHSRQALDGGTPSDVDTLVGVGRRKLLRSANKLGPSVPTKSLVSFRKTTADRSAMKSTERVWRGFQKAPVKLNPKAGCAMPNMIALPLGRNHQAPAIAAANATRTGAARWLPRNRNDASVTSQRKRKIPSGAQARPAPSKKLEKERVASIVELEKEGIDGTALRKWMNIIAYGLCAHEVGGGKAESQHLPAVQKPTKFLFGDGFARKHASTHALFQRLFRADGSAWKQAEASASAPVVINTLEDCRRFLLRVRRLPLVAGVSADFLDSSGKPLAAMKAGPRHGSWPKRRRCES